MGVYPHTQVAGMVGWDLHIESPLTIPMHHSKCGSDNTQEEGGGQSHGEARSDAG